MEHSFAIPFPAIVDIEQLIDHCQPDSLLYIGNELPYESNQGAAHSVSIGLNYSEQRAKIMSPCELNSIDETTPISDSAFTKRYDLAIVGSALEARSKVEGQQLLSRLRDLCSPRMAVLVNFSACDWQPQDLLAFGLVRLDHYQKPIDNNDESKPTEFGLYHYNIDNYKHTPDWLNADNWANPKLWDKVWW